MISAIQNDKTAFTSVIPIRVMVNGKEGCSKAVAQPVCHQLAKILSGPAKGNEKSLNFMNIFAKIDPDFDYNRAVNGYKLSYGKSRPSDFFRYIRDDKTGENYLVTGKDAERIKRFGKNVGLIKYDDKLRNIPEESIDLSVARGNYWGTIKLLLRNKLLRLTEAFNYYTLQRLGDPVELVINTRFDGWTRANKPRFTLDSINFQKQLT